jgi:membrane protein implicated in regulation of membrane protease activity
VKRASNVREIPFRHVVMVGCAALLVQAVNIIAFKGTTQLIVTVVIAVAMVLALRALYRREYRRFPHGRGKDFPRERD